MPLNALYCSSKVYITNLYLGFMHIFYMTSSWIINFSLFASAGAKILYFSCLLFFFPSQVNTQAPSNVTDCSDRNNSKYYIVVVQVPQFESIPLFYASDLPAELSDLTFSLL